MAPTKFSHLLLEIVERCTCSSPARTSAFPQKPRSFLKHTLRVVSKGYGFPSIFNADAVVQEQLRQGKSLETRVLVVAALRGSRRVWQEAYILTGYFNMPKCLELGCTTAWTRKPASKLGHARQRRFIQNFDEVFASYQAQFRHFLTSS